MWRLAKPVDRWSALGLAIAFFGVPVCIFVILPLTFTTFPALLLATNLSKWGLCLLLAVLVIRVERRGWDALGFRRPTLEELAFGAVLVLPAVVGVGYLLQFLSSNGVQPDSSAATQLMSVEQWQLIFTAITAGITEEILYRGYPIERLTEITGRPYVAGAIVTAVFVGIHIPAWGWVNGIAQAGIGAVLTVLYLRYRSLTAPITLHLLYDAVVLLVG